MSAPLFHPRTREAALDTVNQCAAAAVRCRAAAREHPGRTGRILRTLASRYDGLSRDWREIAETLPTEAARS